MADAHTNFAFSTVATAPSPATSGTSLVLASGDGAIYPTAPFQVTIFPVGAMPTKANAEIARCTAKSTDTLTLVRAQEGTTARTVVVGDQIIAGVTAKTLTDLELIPTTTQASSYTVALADNGTLVETTSATSMNVTVPPNSSVAFPLNSVIEICQYGAGQVTLVAGAGVTLRTPATLTTRAQYSTVSVRKRATDEWVVSGDLT